MGSLCASYILTLFMLDCQYLMYPPWSEDTNHASLWLHTIARTGVSWACGNGHISQEQCQIVHQSKARYCMPRKSLLNLSNLSHTILNTQIINCTLSACYRYCSFKTLFKGTNKEIYKQLIIARKWRNNVLYIYFKLRAHSFRTIPEWEYTELMVTVFFWDLFWFQNERNGAELTE